MTARGPARRIVCVLCGRDVGVSWVLHDWERHDADGTPLHPERRRAVARYATRIDGGWAIPVNHRQLLASGRLGVDCCQATTGKRVTDPITEAVTV